MIPPCSPSWCSGGSLSWASTVSTVRPSDWAVALTTTRVLGPVRGQLVGGIHADDFDGGADQGFDANVVGSSQTLNVHVLDAGASDEGQEVLEVVGNFDLEPSVVDRPEQETVGLVGPGHAERVHPATAVDVRAAVAELPGEHVVAAIAVHGRVAGAGDQHVVVGAAIEQVV